MMTEQLAEVSGGFCVRCSACSQWIDADKRHFGNPPGEGLCAQLYCFNCGNAYNKGYAACEAASKGDKSEAGRRKYLQDRRVKQGLTITEEVELIALNAWAKPDEPKAVDFGHHTRCAECGVLLPTGHARIIRQETRGIFCSDACVEKWCRTLEPGEPKPPNDGLVEIGGILKAEGRRRAESQLRDSRWWDAVLAAMQGICASWTEVTRPWASGDIAAEACSVADAVLADADKRAAGKGDDDAE